MRTTGYGITDERCMGCITEFVLTVYAILTIFLVGENPAQIYFGEQAHEVGENHPESTIVAVSLPWGFWVR